MLRDVERLIEIAHRCRAGKPLDDGLSRWLAASLDEFLSQRSRTIEEALGLRGAQGGVSWRMELAIRTRNAALRGLADRLRPARSTAALAKRVHALTIRYAATAWRYDRDRDAMPMRYAGTGQECLWRAFKSGAAMPICERQLRSILAG